MILLSIGSEVGINMAGNGVALRRFILNLKNDIQMNNLLKMHKDCQAGNGAKPNVRRSTIMRCSCGRFAKMPLCKKCFNKQLNKKR
jgi:hypothetical protein